MKKNFKKETKIYFVSLIVLLIFPFLASAAGPGGTCTPPGTTGGDAQCTEGDCADEKCFCHSGGTCVKKTGAGGSPCAEDRHCLPDLTCDKTVGTGKCIAKPSGAESVEWTSPLGGTTSPSQLIGKVIKAVLGIIGAIALLIFVYGGLMWMTSGGSPEKIKKAQTTLVWAVLGLAVIFASYTLVDFVLKQFGV